MGPAMPTGAVFDQTHLDALAEPVLQHDAWVLYDAAMERIRFPQPRYRQQFAGLPGT
jgi:aspartate/methionine/tyrosine aminotransferase